MSNTIQSLTCYYQNVRGLRSKTNEIYKNICSNDFDVICLVETWLDGSIHDNEIFNDNYTVFRRDRDMHTSQKSYGGGSVIAISNRFNVFEQRNWSCKNVEDVWISLPLPNNNSKIHVCCVYLPGYLSLDTLSEFYESITTLLNENPNDIFLINGDFNLPNISWLKENTPVLLPSVLMPDRKSILFSDFLSITDLKQFNNILNKNNRVLDLVLCNKENVLVESCESPLIWEDLHHKSIIINFTLEHNIKQINKNFSKRDYCRCNFTLLNDVINSYDWNFLFENLDINLAVNKFYNVIYSIIVANVPLKTFNKKKFPVWFKSSTVKIFREKMKFHRKWKVYKQLVDYNSFSILRKRLIVAINRDYTDWTNSIENNLKTNPKVFWSYVSAKKKTPNIPQYTILDNQTADNYPDACNLFNKSFQSNFEPTTLTNHNFKSSRETDSAGINLTYIRKDTIFELLEKIDPNKGPGPDGLNPIFIKNCAPSLSEPLYILFNKSLRDGIFPDLWKQALVTPVLKNGSKNDVTNYRPISKLNILAKIFENIITKFLSSTLKNIIIPEQHGFQSKKSTVTNLLTFSEYLHSNIDGGGQVDVICTDFKKAFDKVNHDLLIKKLISLGIHGNLLRWLISYITNRMQAVAINNCVSEFIKITSGIPQGSHLGPVLFIIFLNDINICFKKTKFLLYADDLKVYIRINSLQDCLNLENDLNNFFNYCKENFLFLNISKCQFISFTRKFQPITFKYSLGGTSLSRVNVIKDLGVYLDSKLIFDTHIDKITSSALRNLGFIIRSTKDFSAPESAIHLYKSLVCSKLEYASLVWNPHYKVYIDRVEAVQKRFLKFLDYKFYKNNICPTYEHRLDRYLLLSLSDRRLFLDMCSLYKIVNGLTDCSEILGYLNFSVPRINTRQKNTFYLENKYSNIGNFSPLNRSLASFNNFFNTCDIFFLTIRQFKNRITSLLSNSTVF